MGRKTEFIRDQALSKATELFWANGYVNSSLKQLLSAMEIGEGSFYHAFGSKKALYKECIEHYNTTYMKGRNTAIAGGTSPRKKLFGFFEIVLEEMESRNGCLFSNSLSAEVIVDSELRSFLFGQIDSFLEVLEEIIAEGVKTGEFRSNVKPKYAAKNFFTYLHGVFRLSAYKFNKKEARKEVDLFLKSLLT